MKLLFINLLKQCNVNCQRCFLTVENRSEVRPYIDGSLITKALKSNYIQQSDEVIVLFQGGEPTIVGPEKMAGYIASVKQVSSSYQVVVISNMFNLPGWFVDITHKELNSRIETTFAMGAKASLAGDEQVYLNKFRSSLIKASDNNIAVVINVELNLETVLNGPQALFDYLISTRSKYWEFDISIDFKSFMLDEKYNTRGYPDLPLSVSYGEASAFLIDFAMLYDEVSVSQGIYCGTIETARGGENNAFNVRQEQDFITVNPDGAVTTNPLFADLKKMYIGNLRSSELDTLIDNPLRHHRIRSEVVRTMSCGTCEYFDECQGGASHAPLYDDVGFCAGFKPLRLALNGLPSK